MLACHLRPFEYGKGLKWGSCCKFSNLQWQRWLLMLKLCTIFILGLSHYLHEKAFFFFSCGLVINSVKPGAWGFLQFLWAKYGTVAWILGEIHSWWDWQECFPLVKGRSHCRMMDSNCSEITLKLFPDWWTATVISMIISELFPPWYRVNTHQGPHIPRLAWISF